MQVLYKVLVSLDSFHAGAMCQQDDRLVELLCKRVVPVLTDTRTGREVFNAEASGNSWANLMKIEGMCPGYIWYLSHNDENRDNRDWEDDEDSDDGATRKCDNESGKEEVTKWRGWVRRQWPCEVVNDVERWKWKEGGGIVKFYSRSTPRVL